MDQDDHRRKHKHQWGHGQLLRDPERRRLALQVSKKIGKLKKRRRKKPSKIQDGNLFVNHICFFYQARK